MVSPANHTADLEECESCSSDAGRSPCAADLEDGLVGLHDSHLPMQAVWFARLTTNGGRRLRPESERARALLLGLHDSHFSRSAVWFARLTTNG